MWTSDYKERKGWKWIHMRSWLTGYGVWFVPPGEELVKQEFGPHPIYLMPWRVVICKETDPEPRE